MYWLAVANGFLMLVFGETLRGIVYQSRVVTIKKCHIHDAHVRSIHAPVQAYIAATPGWKRDVARRLDTLIVRTVPNVRKAVKWNSPLYGIEGRGWFLSLHCYTKYLKVAFFRGTSLRPLPPGESTQKEVRYLDIRQDDPLDEELIAKWLRQAAALPGWK